MKKNTTVFLIILLGLSYGLSGFSSGSSLFAQETDAVSSGVQVAATGEITDFILNSIRNYSSEKKPTILDFSPYTLNDRRCGYGDFLSAALRSRLTQAGRNRIGVRATEYLPLLRQNNPDFLLPEIDFLITGKFFRIGTDLHIQTLMIDPATGLIRAVHDSSVPITPEMLPLLTAAADTGQSDLFEPDGQDNPTILLANNPGDPHTLTAGDEDWYSYTAEHDGIISFRTNGNLDTVINAYGPDDPAANLAYNDDFGESSNAAVSLMVAPGSTYYFQVQGYDEEQIGEYNVLLSFEENTDPLEPNNTMPEASAFSMDSGTLNTQFFPQNDIDWFELSIPGVPGTPGLSGSEIKLTIRTRGALDPEITLYDAAGEMIGTDDDSGGDYNALLSVDVAAGSSYFLEVHEIEGLTGNYSIEVSVEP